MLIADRLCHLLTDSQSKILGKIHGDGIANDLIHCDDVLRCIIEKVEGIRKGLDTGNFPYGEAAVLRWMDDATVLRLGRGRNRAIDFLAGEATVEVWGMVTMHVIADTAEACGKLIIGDALP